MAVPKNIWVARVALDSNKERRGRGMGLARPTIWEDAHG